MKGINAIRRIANFLNFFLDFHLFHAAVVFSAYNEQRQQKLVFR